MEEREKVRNAQIIYGLFQGSQIVSFPKIIAKTSLNSRTESRATMQSKSGVLGKWSESVVLAINPSGEL